MRHTQETKDKVIELHAAGKSIKQIAKALKMSQGTVGSWVSKINKGTMKAASATNRDTPAKKITSLSKDQIAIDMLKREVQHLTDKCAYLERLLGL